MLRVLVVDDTKSVHSFVRRLLGTSPEVSLTDVYNGSEALELLAAGGEFDLILLDWEMPVMTGPETLAELMRRGLKTPVIMMTTKNAPEDIQRCLELGASEYMMKPFTWDIIDEKISYVCGKGLGHAA